MGELAAAVRSDRAVEPARQQDRAPAPSPWADDAAPSELACAITAFRDVASSSTTERRVSFRRGKTRPYEIAVCTGSPSDEFGPGTSGNTPFDRFGT